MIATELISLTAGQKVVLQTALGLPAIIVCARLLRRVRERGGRVSAAAFGLPDLLLAFVLVGFFSLLPIRNLADDHARPGQGTADIQLSTENQIAGSMVIFAGLAGVVWGSLRYRKLHPMQIFGLKRVPFWRAALVGTLIVAAIFPLLAGLASAIQDVLQEAAKEQEVVTYFRQMQEAGKARSMALVIFAAVIFQPAVEEFLFRGYFYGVFKGWAGAAASALFTATVFATIHMSVAALLPLLVFALVLTLAYEWSGSLLVPIAMHMVFNGTQLALMVLMPQLVGS